MTSMEDNQNDCNTDLTLAIGSGQSSIAPSRDHLQNEVEKIQSEGKSSSETQELVVEKKQKYSDRSVHKRKYDREQDGNNVQSLSSCNRDGNSYVARKKIKYSEEQIGILEEAMTEHHTFTAAIKRDLAAELHITERQVGDWIQNRKARDKLKRVDDDCEIMKRCCLTLTEENKKVKEKLQELRSVKLAATSTVTSLPTAACRT